MKELSIEEKVKCYDEALEKAKMVLQERGNEPDGASVLSDLFPELAESEDERIRKDCIKYLDWEYQHCSTNEDKIKIEKCIDWLEKQGKENPLKGTLGDVFDDIKLGIDPSPKQGEQKSTDKIEPKFKVGDWIVFNGLTLYIEEVVEGFYRTISKGGITNSYGWDIDNAARLWTIQDAKDGDVLSYREGQWVFIFKKDRKEHEIAYHALISDKGLSVNDVAFIVLEDSVAPATKEQHDTLYAKIKEADYKWDAEKKELKKIEQKPNKCMYSNDNYTDEDRKVLCDGCEEDCKLKQKPVEWSEEDELRIENLIAIIEGRGYPGEVIWLKNLKNRVQPQPKQEWSEEDEKMIRALVSMCDVWATSHQFYPKGNKEMEALKTWLKSIHPKKQWKPSEEQIKAMYAAVNLIVLRDTLHPDNIKALDSLYNDLKAL